MKKIVIHQENSDTITLLDEDSTNLDSYSNDMVKILESQKICIVETTSGNILLKPAKIISIFVTELEETNNIKKDSKIKKEKNKNETKEDVIRD